MSAAAKPAKIDAWWFAASDRLPHGDRRKIVIGKKHSVRGTIVLCENALHASRDPFDALYHAPGEYLYRVRCWGEVVEEDDKLGARNREYVAMRDATGMFRRFAREQALSVIHLWDAPEIVRLYLEIGDVAAQVAAKAAAVAAVSLDVDAPPAAAFWAATAAAEAASTPAMTAAIEASVATIAAMMAASAGDDGVEWAAKAARKRFGELVADLFAGGAP